jgi:hypothetical protein|tara:strand:+ start:27 stop:251 length:225 start_codon:yes stop_codon:yes gene_type:complete
MDNSIFNLGDLVKLSPYGEATLGTNPVGERLMGKNGFIISQLTEKIGLVGYHVRFVNEDPIFLSVDELTLIKSA